MSKGQFSPRFFLKWGHTRIILEMCYQTPIHYNNMILVIFYNPTCTRSVLFGLLRMGEDTWLSQMPLYEVEKTLTSKYVSSYLKTRRDLHLLSLVDNWINYIYNCRFIRISSLLFERIIREANDIFVVQNTMIIIL